jgi:hypothetical protein
VFGSLRLCPLVFHCSRGKGKFLILFLHRDFTGPVFQRIKFLLQDISMKLEMGEVLAKEDVGGTNAVTHILTEFLNVNSYLFETMPALSQKKPDDQLKQFFIEETERLFRKPIALMTIEEVTKQKRTFIIKPDMTVKQMLVLVRRKLNHEVPLPLSSFRLLMNSFFPFTHEFSLSQPTSLNWFPKA